MFLWNPLRFCLSEGCDKSKSGKDQEHICLIPEDKKQTIPLSDFWVKATCQCTEWQWFLELGGVENVFHSTLVGRKLLKATPWWYNVPYLCQCCRMCTLWVDIYILTACSCKMDGLWILVTKHAVKWLVCFLCEAAPKKETSQTGLAWPSVNAFSCKEETHPFTKQWRSSNLLNVLLKMQNCQKGCRKKYG